METIKVTTPDCYGYPKITGKVGSRVEFYFRINKDWQALYDEINNNTHKICGVKDLLGLNSLRLGVRRSQDEANRSIGVVAVAYSHRNGSIGYPPIKTPEGRTVLLRYDTNYFCRIVKDSTGWSISLYKPDQTFIATYFVPVTIYMFPRLSGLYVEPSLNVSIDFQLITP